MKKALHTFLESNKEYPIFSGFICGLYAFLFYYSNNFAAIFSWAHFFYFFLVFVGVSVTVFGLIYYALGKFEHLKAYRQQALFVLIITVTITLLSQAVFLTLKKKLIVLAFVVSIALAWKLFSHYKKLVVLIMVMSIIPIAKCLIHVYEHVNATTWIASSESLSNLVFKHSPNIYVIQPDGYVAHKTLERAPYNHKSDLYNWLADNDFKLYENVRSNYAASLASNASMFAMKQHRYANMIRPTFELPEARRIISGSNPVIDVLKQNNYHTSFIVQDEYFQQNRDPLVYDYYNIKHEEIPFFSNDNNIKKVVFEDLKYAMTLPTDQPRFYFVEKLLPHHIHFEPTVEEDRASYVKLIDSVNVWLRKTITHIEKNDDNALIVVLADHGGWLGVSNYDQMFTTRDETELNSIYSVLAAIKWNGYDHEDVDLSFRSNVNLFRILFAALSEDKTYLEDLEDDSSYNLLKDSMYFNAVNQVIDSDGNFVFNKLD
ncbi:sulfatase-like hydrolase/transferase [Psychroserpens sp.]|uniref:sulfatase-like hydrolase/transferase n=1 Tax=Psychroserpens sp. TaxID=2020870 RepID=UPI001B121303|nr:sulfatase-like hydrolase/transferase [Psychroserpens sp.]MBO6606139.1 hypothetical protein [Psychroserpens sp.]MBO6652489.1 hypothetical protein [Psychroserpens sp.]MBO6681739.1 hypothetical protein [Psychroserpens sp.]MBO6749514.1 hypothetical protein [Psychroserpens sp.]MBO6914041.1 hypothetical protein [Psychroserpens sp.]